MLSGIGYKAYDRETCERGIVINFQLNTPLAIRTKPNSYNADAFYFIRLVAL